MSAKEMIQAHVRKNGILNKEAFYREVRQAARELLGELGQKSQKKGTLANCRPNPEPPTPKPRLSGRAACRPNDGIRKYMNRHPTPTGADGPQLTMTQETTPAFTPPFGWDVKPQNGGEQPVARATEMEKEVQFFDELGLYDPKSLDRSVSRFGSNLDFVNKFSQSSHEALREHTLRVEKRFAELERRVDELSA